MGLVLSALDINNCPPEAQCGWEEDTYGVLLPCAQVDLYYRHGSESREHLLRYPTFYVTEHRAGPRTHGLNENKEVLLVLGPY